MVNVALILFMVLSIILLFVAMVFSAMASTDAHKGSQKCKENCSKYSMWSALVAGISVALIFVSLIIYIYVSREHITKHLIGAQKGRAKFPAGFDPRELPDV